MRPSLADAPEPRFSQRSHVSRRVPFAPLVRRLAAIRQLRRGPLPHQALVARMVTSVAIVLESVGHGWQAGGWQAGWWWQLGGAPPVGRTAAIELLLTGPTLHPLKWTEVIVTRSAIKWTLCCCERRCRASLVLAQAAEHLL